MLCKREQKQIYKQLLPGIKVVNKLLVLNVLGRDPTPAVPLDTSNMVEVVSIVADVVAITVAAMADIDIAVVAVVVVVIVVNSVDVADIGKDVDVKEIAAKVAVVVIVADVVKSLSTFFGGFLSSWKKYFLST